MKHWTVTDFIKYFKIPEWKARAWYDAWQQ